MTTWSRVLRPGDFGFGNMGDYPMGEGTQWSAASKIDDTSWSAVEQEDATSWTAETKDT